MRGELLSFLVAVMWTFTAIFAEIAGKRIGTLVLNVWRMILTIVLLGGLLWLTCGKPWPQYATPEVWKWFLASGFMGFAFGDYCLFNAYIIIGSRYAQLFMTLGSPFAAITAWLLMGEAMSVLGLLGMMVTLTGIGISILGKDDTGSRHVTLPLRGILLGIGAGLGQGVGIVLSKQGMLHYGSVVPPEAGDVASMMPFAGTQIRAMMGLLVFGISLLLARRFGDFLRAATDLRGAAAAMGAILLGPFFGVSFSIMAVSMTTAGVAQTLMSLTPVLILWPSRLIFGKKVSMQEVVGALIAVAGASLFFI
ncbi:MAG: DMT family transporter [Prevotellaceae bacterium]|nr:DMT family transporter [Prevotellaceae bacterium]